MLSKIEILMNVFFLIKFGKILNYNVCLPNYCQTVKIILFFSFSSKVFTSLNNIHLCKAFEMHILANIDDVQIQFCLP